MAQLAKKCVRADCESEFSRKTRTGFTSDGKADQLKYRILPHGLSSVMSYNRRKSFAEDALGAEADP